MYEKKSYIVQSIIVVQSVIRNINENLRHDARVIIYQLYPIIIIILLLLLLI